ncbi:gamma-aminobutyric acid type B receptor subunit 2-like [Dysidea avara]|uniref:gamma-aminobutyric acid type B receptor subunit 2-like n=1 Tax=Dysidea avara TaxID=196820 RepID=UPI003316C82B
MGEIAQRFLHISQVSYTASSSLFGEDKFSYPRFYRLVPITEQVADGYVAVVKKLRWRRVAVISHDSELHLSVGRYTVDRLTNNSIHVLTHESFGHDPTHVIKSVKRVNARIIITWIPHTVAVHFWCMVIRERLAGPDFVWFLPGWFKANWWSAGNDTSCSANKIKATLEHTLGGLGNSLPVTNLSRIIVSDQNVSQFEEDLIEIENSSGSVTTDIFLNYGYIYDAMWTIALALNSSISILEDRGLGRLEDFTYDSVEMANVFTEAVANVSFEGISDVHEYA